MADELDVGSQAPDFSLPAGDGQVVSLADYREKSAVMLFFVREYN